MIPLCRGLMAKSLLANDPIYAMGIAPLTIVRIDAWLATNEQLRRNGLIPSSRVLRMYRRLLSATTEALSGVTGIRPYCVYWDERGA